MFGKLASNLGAVTLGNSSCNLSRNFVATQVAPKIVKCNIARQQLVSQFVLLPQALQEVELDSFPNDCGNGCINFFSIAQCNTLVQLVSQCFA